MYVLDLKFGEKPQKTTILKINKNLLKLVEFMSISLNTTFK